MSGWDVSVCDRETEVPSSHSVTLFIPLPLIWSPELRQTWPCASKHLYCVGDRHDSDRQVKWQAELEPRGVTQERAQGWLGCEEEKLTLEG